MDKIDFVKRNDLESIGKYYFEKAVNFVLEKDYGKASEFFKEGLDYVTCDCGGKWTEKIRTQLSVFFVDIDNSDSNHVGYFFSKAFLYSYYKTKKDLYLGLDAIDRYLEINEDEYGLYVKGKILKKLGDYQEAIDHFILSANINKICSRLNYRIGRTLEQDLNENGLNYLLDALINNPSSICCARVLYSNLKKRNIHLIFKSITIENPIANLFLIVENEDEFQIEYENMLSLNSTTSQNIDDAFSKLEVMTEFVEILKYNLNSLLNNSKVINNRNLNFDYDSNINDNDRDVFDAYSDESYDEWNERGGDIWDLRDSMGY